MVCLPRGEFEMGTDDAEGFAGDGEGRVRVAAFYLSAEPVSNDEFAAFVEGTGYCTEAARFGWSYVFDGFLPV